MISKISNAGQRICPKCAATLFPDQEFCGACLLESAVCERNPSSAEDSFGDYELLEELGRGGQGVVYRARQKSLNRIVALKLIALGPWAADVNRKRFRLEAEAAASLDHPRIVPIFEIGDSDDFCYFSMKFVEGGRLDQIVPVHQISSRRAAGLIADVARTVHYAHQRGILHRDIKPGNILLDASGEPHLTDFGLAKLLEKESTVTQTMDVLGTPSFIAPEQAAGHTKRLTTAADVYGLGAVLYYLLTGQPPFLGATTYETIRLVLEIDPRKLSFLNPAIENDLETICLKCLQKEPAQRYGSAEALAEDLERFLRSEPVLARPVSRPERFWRACRRKPALSTVAAVMVLLLLVVAIGSPIAALHLQHSRKIAEANLYSADLNVAQVALAEADLVRARALLDRHRPRTGQEDMRGFEWRYLWNLCQGDEQYVFEPTIVWPRRVVFSHDGRLLAAGEKRGKLSVVWDLATKLVIKRLPEGDRPVAFSPNSPALITAGQNGLKLWNSDSWTERMIDPTVHFEATAAFTPHAEFLVVHGQGLQVWQTKTWTLVSSNSFGPVNWWVAGTLAISPDGKFLSCARGFPYSTTSELRLFHLPSLEVVSGSEHFPKDISSAAFPPAGDLFLTGGWSGDIRLWDGVSGRELPSVIRQPSRILAIAFSPVNSNRFASTGGDRSVRLWDLDAQKERARLHGAWQEIQELAFSPDGQTIATGGGGNAVTLWEASRTKAEVVIVPTFERTCILGFSDGGKSVVTLDARGEVHLRDATSLKPLKTVGHIDLQQALVAPPTLDFLTLAVAASPGVSAIALGATNGAIELLTLPARPKVLIKAHTAAVRGVAFSPDSRFLASAGEDRAIHLWDLATLSRTASARLADVPDSHWSLCVRFSEAGDLIAAASGKTLTIFESSTLRTVRTFTGVETCLSLRFSPDGRYLASAHGDDQLFVWDTSTWTRRSLGGHELIVEDIAFSPDGRRMLTGSDRLILWDTATWQQLATYKLPIQDLSSIIFSPNGNDLLIGDASGLRVWHAPSFQEIENHEARAGRWCH